MIINGEKWACETCIKGHRATHCRHTDRQLIYIKKKGRPSTQCKRCRQLRIVRQLHVKCECDEKGKLNTKKSNNSVTGTTRRMKSEALRPLAPKQRCNSNTLSTALPSMSSISAIRVNTSTDNVKSIDLIDRHSVDKIKAYINTRPSLPLFSHSCISNSSAFLRNCDNHSQLQQHISALAEDGPSSLKFQCCVSKFGPTETLTGLFSATEEEIQPHSELRGYDQQNPTMEKLLCPNKPTSPQVLKTCHSRKNDNSISPLPLLSSTSILHPADSAELPNIPPPSSCCGPPSKNQQGEVIRVVTCRCGDSCACVGCDAHPSRAMKESTKDVYIGFSDYCGTNQSKNLSIPEICSEAQPSSTTDHPSSILSDDGVLLCGCGCLKALEDCTCCFNDMYTPCSSDI